MKERPILFSASMVRALLAGTKTQTRRVVHDRYLVGGPPVEILLKKCPYGQAGDWLWVKETWKPHCDMTDLFTCIKYRADGAMVKPSRWSDVEGWYAEQNEESTKWWPSIFMRRGYSRLTLEVVAVRVERLNEILPTDAIAEGLEVNEASRYGDVVAYRDYLWKAGKGSSHWYRNPVESYRALWDSINGGGSWSMNPWVWVVEFRRVEG